MFCCIAPPQPAPPHQGLKGQATRDGLVPPSKQSASQLEDSRRSVARGSIEFDRSVKNGAAYLLRRPSASVAEGCNPSVHNPSIHNPSFHKQSSPRAAAPPSLLLAPAAAPAAAAAPAPVAAAPPAPTGAFEPAGQLTSNRPSSSCGIVLLANMAPDMYAEADGGGGSEISAESSLASMFSDGAGLVPAMSMEAPGGALGEAQRGSEGGCSARSSATAHAAAARPASSCNGQQEEPEAGCAEQLMHIRRVTYNGLPGSASGDPKPSLLADRRGSSDLPRLSRNSSTRAGTLMHRASLENTFARNSLRAQAMELESMAMAMDLCTRLKEGLVEQQAAKGSGGLDSSSSPNPSTPPTPFATEQPLRKPTRLGESSAAIAFPSSPGALHRPGTSPAVGSPRDLDELTALTYFSRASRNPSYSALGGAAHAALRMPGRANSEPNHAFSLAATLASPKASMPVPVPEWLERSVRGGTAAHSGRSSLVGSSNSGLLFWAERSQGPQKP